VSRYTDERPFPTFQLLFSTTNPKHQVSRYTDELADMLLLIMSVQGSTFSDLLFI